MGVDDWSDDVFYLSVSRDNRVNRANTDELMSGKICTVTLWKNLSDIETNTKEDRKMKKKNILLLCLCAAMITGCGNRSESAPAGGDTNTAESGVLSGTEGEAEDVGASGAEVETEDVGASGAEVETEGVGASGAEGETEDVETSGAIAAETDAPENGAVEDEGGVSADNAEAKPDFTFGDKATMNNHVNGRELPIYCVDTEEKKVALSFDAAWGNEDTEELLAILKEHDLHVTFFMTGGWVESYPEDVKAILEAGHDLGNHSENHKNMSELSDEEKKEEILSVHRKVKEITGYDMFLFRPPYGDYDNALIDVLKDCNYYAIQWDVDSLDWKNEGVDAILTTVTEHKNLGNGSIILCHNGGEYTAEALDTLIQELEAQGYEIVPVSELIYPDNYHMDVQGRQIADES